MALNLESEQVGCIIFGDDQSISQDDSVRSLSTLVKTQVGFHMLSRVTDGIGQFMMEVNLSKLRIILMLNVKLLVSLLVSQ